METIPKLQINNLNKSYGALPTLTNISLVANRGEFVSLVGPSGCGKSTLFNILAGLETADSGEFRYDNQPFQPQPGKMAYMLQRDALLPWRSALDNAALGLELAGTPRKIAREHALAYFEIFGLKGFEKSFPWQMSGGMRQRLALLRTFLSEREVMLLDEPFGALDALTRAGLQEWLAEMQAKLRRTILFITHDIEEALLLSERIYLFTHLPTTIRVVQEVLIPKPRSVSDSALVELKARLLAILKPEADFA
ncbi:ABC transporter ATP-binding protein [Candidatus Chlorohelix sp.]|uniref:ABC transporter ATP-binding protein n=1 Tax=Candidatus Chlorohelix sp. TaxID=3139201 RepID=UPI00303C3590